ncbi:hypothetical protein VPH35_069665 [Triticum aestivum]
MATPPDVRVAMSSGSRGVGMEDLDNFFGQLDLEDEVFDDLVINEVVPEISERVRWMALARVHTDESFNHSAFFKDMRAAWNAAQPIHQLPDGYCNKDIVEKLIRKAGEIMVLRLVGNSRGDYIRVRVTHDVREPLTNHVSIVKGRERQVFAVRYEKLARFCKFCGKIGHDFKECGTAVYTAKELKFGEWFYADPPNMNRSEFQGGGRTIAAVASGNHGGEGLKNTTSIPMKSLSTRGVTEKETLGKASDNMEEDNGLRKHILVEGGDATDPQVNPLQLLAITSGNGEDGQATSLTSSTDSERARTEASLVDGLRNSAGSRVELRREQ